MSEVDWRALYLEERALRKDCEKRLAIGRALTGGAVVFGCFMCCVVTFLEGLDFIASH